MTVTTTLLYFYPLFYDPYMLLLIPPLILAIYAQSRVKSAFRRYSEVGSIKGYSGAEAAIASSLQCPHSF